MVPTASLAMTPEDVPVAEPVYFSAGVADPGGRAGYLADGAGVAAVGLIDGRLLWRSERARQPLISDGSRLVAVGAPGPSPNVVDVVVLDATRGELVLVSDSIVLPDWAAASPGGAGRLRWAARLQRTGLRLEWEAHPHYGGGAPPPPRVVGAGKAAGACEIDLTSGAVVELSREDEGATARGGRRPPLLPDDVGEPWYARSAVVRLLWETDGADQLLLLEVTRPSSMESVDRVALARGSGLVAQVTPDGCHLLVHQEPAPAGRDPWWVYSATSGSKVATVTHDAGSGWPSIVDRRVFYLVQATVGAVRRRALRARELASDALAWELPLGERPISAAPRLRP